MLERFQREARAASSLNHPGICTVHSIEQHEGQQFIVMELLEGRTLAERMAAAAFDDGECFDIGTQYRDALESAHANGIVHRALKPVNLFVQPARPGEDPRLRAGEDRSRGSSARRRSPTPESRATRAPT